MSEPATILYTPLTSVPNVAENGHRDVDGRDGDDREFVRARYFGPDQRLLGIFDKPETASKCGVVLCYPQGADYESAFRSFRILGTRLARAGFHVLRFDYSGTGDSWGEIGDASLDLWIQDTVAAVRELRVSHRLQHVSLVGLRLGATLAALAAADCEEVERLVLWEPVVEGRDYLRSLASLHEEWIAGEHRSGRGKRAAADDLLGYPLTPGLIKELDNLRLSSLTKLPAPHVYVVSHEQSAARNELVASLRSKGADIDEQLIDGPTIWSRSPTMPEAVVPNRTLQVIVNWICGAPA